MNEQRFEDTPISARVLGLWLPNLPAGTNIYTASASERRSAWDRLQASLPRSRDQVEAFIRARRDEARQQQQTIDGAVARTAGLRSEAHAMSSAEHNRQARKKTAERNAAHDRNMSEVDRLRKQAEAGIRTAKSAKINPASVYAARREAPGEGVPTRPPKARTFAALAEAIYQPSPGTALIGSSARGGGR